jgi:hypothetical protein
MKGRISFLNENFNTQKSAGVGSILIPFGRKNVGAILSSKIEGKWFQ